MTLTTDHLRNTLRTLDWAVTLYSGNCGAKRGQDQFAKPRAELSGKLPVRGIDPEENLVDPVRGRLFR